MTNGIDGVKPPPGFTSVASATADAALDQHSRRREAPSLRKNAAAGSSVAIDAGRGQAVGVRLVDEDQMIRGSRADIGGDRAAAAQRELVGVNPRLQAVRRAGPQMSRRFFRREHALLAEHVAPFREAFAGDGRDHHVDDQVDVLARRSRILHRVFVRAHERRRELDRLRRPPVAESRAASSARTRAPARIRF